MNLDLCELPTGIQEMGPAWGLCCQKAPCSKPSLRATPYSGSAAGWGSPILHPCPQPSLHGAAGASTNQVAWGLAPQSLQ